MTIDGPKSLEERTKEEQKKEDCIDYTCIYINNCFVNIVAAVKLVILVTCINIQVLIDLI